jgi:hypothetical protein
MPTSVTCPDCDARLTLRTTPVAGARLKCPKCATQFTYTDSSDAETSASKKSSISAPKKSAIGAGSPVRRQRDQDEDDESERPRGRSAASSDEPDEEDEERRPRKKKKAKTASKTGLIIGLAVGAGGLVVLGIVVVVVVVVFALREKPGVVQQQAKGDPPEQLVKNQPVPPQPVKNKDGKPNDPGPVAPPVPQPPKKLTPAELYGDQGGEQVAAANAGLPSTLMRARRDDTFIKLSNPREAEVKGPDAKGKGNSTVRQALLIDYVVVRRGKFDGGILVMHTDDGQRAEVALNLLAGRDQGTIQLVGVTSVGFFKKQQINSKTEFPKNAEFYVTRGDDRYLPPSKFMVSNSAVMGVMKVTSRARDWTAEEIDRYGNPPPAYRSPNLQPATLGADVPALNGWPWKNRYVEPEGRLLGLEYNLGEWAKVKRIGGLVPVFRHDQPPSLPSRELARPGYAVAGAEVNFDKDGIVFGIRLLFRRVKTDNNLDAADAYAGQWIGTPPTGAPTVLANDGRRVMGMSSQNGAVVDRFALVIAR